MNARRLSSRSIFVRHVWKAVYKDAKLGRAKKDQKQLRHIRMSRNDAWMTVAIVILMLMAMALGFYLGRLFKGRIVEM